MPLNFDSLERSIQSLEKAILYTNQKIKDRILSDEIEILQAGVIQNFEITYELSWKFMKRWLREQVSDAAGIDGLTRKELLREAQKYNLIDSLDNWFVYHRARNESSHNYNQEVATETYETALKFLSDAKSLLTNMQAKND
ncbi:MAG: HI0074 family nucleotidyltransferase substrate-binding subunit [Brevinema sp.]